MFCREKLKTDVSKLCQEIDSPDANGEHSAYKDIATRADRNNKKLWNEKIRCYEPFTKDSILNYIDRKIAEISCLRNLDVELTSKLKGYSKLRKNIMNCEIGFRNNSLEN